MKIKENNMTPADWGRMWGIPTVEAYAALQELLHDGLVEKKRKYIDGRPLDTYRIVASHFRKRSEFYSDEK